MIKITFPDGSVREYESGVTGYEIAESISQRLAQDVLACSVNDQITELNRPITTDATIKLHKWEDEEAKHAYWHTSAHLMAEALQELYPGTQFGIGPAIEKGFYYDIMPPEGVTIKESDFPAIEAKMKELVLRRYQRPMLSSSLPHAARAIKTSSLLTWRTVPSPHTHRVTTLTFAADRTWLTPVPSRQ